MPVESSNVKEWVEENPTQTSNSLKYKFDI